MSRKLTVFYFLLACFFGNAQKAQNSVIDSLEVLYDLAEQHYLDYDYSKSILTAKKLVDYAQEVGNDVYLAWGYDIIAGNNAFINEMAEAETAFLKALYHADIAPEYEIKSYVYYNAAQFYGDNPEHIKASEELHLKAVELACKEKDTASLIYNYIGLSYAHRLAGNLDMAEDYLKQSGPYINSSKASPENTLSYHFLKGIFASSKGKKIEAKKHFETALKLAKKDNIEADYLEVFYAYGEFLLATNQFEEASAIYQKYADLYAKNFNSKKVTKAKAANSRMKLEEYKNTMNLMQRDKEYSDMIIKRSRQNVTYGAIVFMALNILLTLLFINKKRLSKANKNLQGKNKELTVAKNDAERLAKVRERFISRVSHELRTPLYGVIGLTDILEEKHPQIEQDENLRALKFSGNYLMTLINNILQVDKIDAAKVVVQNKPFCIQRLVTDLGNTFNFSLNKKGNKLHVHIDNNICQTLMGDAPKISQILVNLLGNASKFTKNGNVWLDIRLVGQSASANTIKFTVKDDGIGISEANQETIFDEFSQVGKIQSAYQGTGLGLSIVKYLVEAMDSKVIFHSELNKGTEFSFEITFALGQDTGTPCVENRNIKPLTSRIYRVLAVDDNKINLLVARKYLAGDDFECITVENGYEGIRLFEKEQFDLVLMDINMPEINGIETAKHIRAINDEVPIIAFTAVDQSASNKDYIAEGFNDLIIKPCSKEQLLHTVWKNLKDPAKLTNVS